MRKPGVMFYFEVRPSLRRLSTYQRGKLFNAILDYGEYGIEPELEGEVGVAWDFLRPKLDRDNERYDRVVRQREYAIYCRYEGKNPQERLSFDQWLEAAAAYDRSASDTDEYQTSNYKPQTTNSKQQTPNSKESEGPKATPVLFSPPGKEAILAYCLEKKCPIDVDSFLDYYTANGWKIGKSPMKDWKAAVRRWHRKGVDYGEANLSGEWNVGTTV